MATRGKNNKNNKNYNDIIEEERPSSQVLRSSDEQNKNNFVDVVVSPAPVTAPLTDDNCDDLRSSGSLRERDDMEINETCKIFFNDDF